jgi:hypothetical protein
METSITVAEEDQSPPPPPDKILRLFHYIFLPTGLPLIRHKSILVPLTLTLSTNLILGSSTFCLLYYPNYYINQGYIWTADIFLGWIVYNYSLYLHAKWDTTACVDSTPIKKHKHYITLSITGLYYVYWLYFYVIQNILHFDTSVFVQLVNALMGTAWYLFFSTMGSLYYAICFTMNQRAEAIRIWLKDVKDKGPSLPVFYLQYNARYKAIRQFSKNWNILVFLGFLLLSFHIPIDLFSVLYSKNYYDSFGVVVKSFSLFWYIYCICELNDYESVVIAYLYKHRLFPASELEEIEKYSSFRPLGLNFYGIKVNHSTMTKVVILTLNFLVPTLYALISNKVFD